MADKLTLGFCSYQDGSFELIVQNEKYEEITLKGKLKPGQLGKLEEMEILPGCVMVQYGVVPLISIPADRLMPGVTAAYRVIDNNDGSAILHIGVNPAGAIQLHFRDRGELQSAVNRIVGATR